MAPGQLYFTARNLNLNYYIVLNTSYFFYLSYNFAPWYWI